MCYRYVKEQYCLDLLQDTSLLAAKPALTPMDTPRKLYYDYENFLPNPTQFIKLIDNLIFLTHS